MQAAVNWHIHQGQAPGLLTWFSVPGHTTPCLEKWQSYLLLSLSLPLILSASQHPHSPSLSHPLPSSLPFLSLAWNLLSENIHLQCMFAGSIIPLNKCVLYISQRFKGVHKFYRNCLLLFYHSDVFILIIIWKKTFCSNNSQFKCFSFIFTEYILVSLGYSFFKLGSIVPSRDSRTYFRESIKNKVL